MPSKIKPCPFCGATDCTVDLDIGVTCDACQCTGPIIIESTEEELTEEEYTSRAIELWNNRWR